ncbi:hypothetical protein V8G54_036683 [Vigna mungo]|uniref:Uncharacterized protein n=1 Tax=Vigna mungo TaxID=3915 RepID=A0AAQ3MIY0_VIGMU
MTVEQELFGVWICHPFSHSHACIRNRIVKETTSSYQAKDPERDLTDYFDVIGGTNTGSTTTAMLATPSLDHPSHPAYTPAQIVDFYKLNGPHIFNQSRYNNFNIRVANAD